MITFTNVTKKFGVNRAVDSVSFQVQGGEFVFLTGPSGSGKSTLIKLINAELTPDEGKIVIDKTSITDSKRSRIPYLRRRIGIVFQDSKLLPDLTVFENIALALRIRNIPVSKIYNQVTESLDSVGMLHRQYAFPSQLAGGELQRACLARAIISQPDVILADEPTGNLDAATSWQIMYLLSQINQKGTTILMATHDTEIVNSFNHRILQIDQGKVIQDLKQEEHEA